MAAALTIEQQRAIAVASARARAKASKPTSEKADPVKEWRSGNPIEAGAVDFIQGAGGLAKGVLNILTPSTDGKNRGVGDLLDNLVADKGSGMSMAGSFADPVAWATGSNVLRALPYTKVLGKGAANALKALSRNAAGGAATGGAVGALGQEGNIGEGAGVGAAANMLLPPAVAGAVRLPKALKNIFKRPPGQLAARAAGDKTGDVIRALETSRAAVPGTQLTAGQAAVGAGSPEFSALQRRVIESDPHRYVGKGGVESRQQAAREAHLGQAVGTPADLATARAARTTASNSAYAAAFAQRVKADPALAKLAQNPFFKQELPAAMRLAQAQGITPKSDLTQFLHIMKLSLDDALSKGKAGATALGKNEQRAIQDVQSRVVEWLGKKNPLYEAARAQHAKASGPIKAMEIGQMLKQALQGQAGTERPSGLMRALRQAENKRGVGGKTQIEALAPAQRQAFAAVESDLTRNETMKRLAQSGTQSMEERIGALRAPPPGIFSPIISAMRSWFNSVTGKMTERGIKELAEVMANDPKKLAQMMREFDPAQRTQVLNAIYGRTAPAIGGIVSGTT